jgi:hypothetical protein
MHVCPLASFILAFYYIFLSVFFYLSRSILYFLPPLDVLCLVWVAGTLDVVWNGISGCGGRISTMDALEWAMVDRLVSVAPLGYPELI